MKNFLCLTHNIDVLPLLHAVQLQPHLWNQHRWRTTYKNSPHLATDVDDIWIRYSDDSKTADPDSTDPVTMDLTPVFYPAWQSLPQVRGMVFDLMRRVEGIELGRVLVTKIRPGGQILAHADADGAYVDAGARYHIVLQGLPGSLFIAGDETVNMQTGSCWWFDHKAVHAVVNNSIDDRIHLLVDFRIAQ
jgi:hypothetical protein